jgi:hypothetical protein
LLRQHGFWGAAGREKEERGEGGEFAHVVSPW